MLVIINNLHLLCSCNFGTINERVVVLCKLLIEIVVKCFK